MTITYDAQGNPIFMGWVRPGTTNNPACFKQGMKTAMRVRFTASRPLSFATRIVFKGDVSGFDESITGGDYVDTVTTVGPTWPSPTPGALTTSSQRLEDQVNLDRDVTISWYYRAPGTNDWKDAGETDDLVYYITYDSPRYRDVAGANGRLLQRHFTVNHIDYACDLAEDHDQPISMHRVASEVVDERGDISINDRHPSTHDDVVHMISYFRTGSAGQCGCYASGLAYLLNILGIPGDVLFSNLLRPLNLDASKVSGIARDAVVGYMTYVGIRWGSGNNWQGAAWIFDRGANTICYDAQHELVKRYWELGNDEDGGRSGEGVLYDYAWRGISRNGQQVQTTTDIGPSGQVLTIIQVPRYRGN